MPLKIKVHHLGYGDVAYVTEVDWPTLDELQAKWDENKREVNLALARLPGIVIPLALIADRSEAHVV